MREFDTGATRDTDEGKLDFEGFLSPTVLQRYAEYMHENRIQADGKLRDSDNWQKGIPQEAYVKSAWRHFFAFWTAWRRNDREAGVQDACALLFNIMGWLHEELKTVKIIVVPAQPELFDEIPTEVSPNWNPQPGPQANFFGEGNCDDSEPICDGDTVEIEPLTEYQTSVSTVESEWAVTCACGYEGTIDELILDQINESCLCPDCAAPLMGLSIEVNVEDTPNLHERVRQLISLADGHDVGRDKLLKMLIAQMGSM